MIRIVGILIAGALLSTWFFACKHQGHLNQVAAVPRTDDAGNTYLYWKRGDTVYEGRCISPTINIKNCQEELKEQPWEFFDTMVRRRLSSADDELNEASKAVNSKIAFYQQHGGDQPEVQLTLQSLQLRQRVYESRRATIDREKQGFEKIISLLESEQVELISGDDDSSESTYISELARSFFKGKKRIFSGNNIGCAFDAEGLKCWNQRQSQVRTIEELPQADSITISKQYVTGGPDFFWGCGLINGKARCINAYFKSSPVPLFDSAHELAIDAYLLCGAFADRLTCALYKDSKFNEFKSIPLVNPRDVSVSIFPFSYCAQTDEGLICGSLSKNKTDDQKVFHGALFAERSGLNMCIGFVDASLMCGKSIHELTDFNPSKNHVKVVSLSRNSNRICAIVDGEPKCGTGDVATYTKVERAEKGAIDISLGMNFPESLCILYSDKVVCNGKEIGGLNF